MNRLDLAERFTELNFVPQDAARWLSPSELQTALSAMVSGVFADYADKRELQKTLPDNGIELPAELADPDGDGMFWFDFTADTGDGFEATFTVASLLAQPSLRVTDVAEELPRGTMLVLGGDEVYPTASSRAYEDRMVGPFRSALPDADPQPLMLVLPGNHDWYDGLTAWLRLFTQQRSIGGWRTEQPRSYFTVKLPHNWWLVGLDSPQPDSYFDDPQLSYFEDTLSQNLAEGDGVIVCCATPAWLKTTDGKPDAFNGLDWFEQNYIRTRRVRGTKEREATGAEVRLWLTGDKHHYLRYEELVDDPPQARGEARQLVTCGLGGAYLDVSHDMPAELALLPEGSRRWRDGDGASTFRQAGSAFPSISDSRRWVKRVGAPWRKEWLVRRNPGCFSGMAVIHLGIFLFLLLLFWQGVRANEAGRIYDAYLEATPAELLGFAGGVLGLVVLAILVAMAPKLRRHSPLVPMSWLMLLLSQLTVNAALFVAFGLIPATLGVLPTWLLFLLSLLGVTVCGGLLGATALGVWIVVFKSKGLSSWAMMGQAIEDGKGFIRISMDPDGLLTLYPLVVDKVVRDFDISPEVVVVSTGRPTKVPVPAGPLPQPRLIEAPFSVARTASASRRRAPSAPMRSSAVEETSVNLRAPVPEQPKP